VHRSSSLITEIKCVASFRRQPSRGSSPRALTIRSVWKNFNAPRLLSVSDSLACRFGTPAVEFVQSGTSLGGRTAGTIFSCGASEIPTISLNIVNGWVRGDSVGFDMDGEYNRSIGTFRDNTMSGITTIRIRLTTRDVVLTGPFTAVR
jgi:hypothetical protein